MYDAPNPLPSLDVLPSRPLGEASAQEIQLELIRRWKFNSFNGELIAHRLLEHRDLWLAVLMDRLGVPNFEGGLPISGLIKLRDLPHNHWNVDTLYVLCKNAELAKRLVAALDSEEYGGMADIHNDRREVDATLGTGRNEFAIVSIWWD